MLPKLDLRLIRPEQLSAQRAMRYSSSWLRGLHLYNKYRDRSMIPLLQFVDNIAIVASHLAGKGGAVIECGTWKGGMSAALIEVCGPKRDYFFFDSFQGMPPAQEIDGQSALEWQRDVEGPYYRNNCSASAKTFVDTLSRAAQPQSVHIMPGFFEDTLPTCLKPEKIAVLRLDADWYDSTMICLDTFWDSVVPGGVVLIDDYWAWDGCCRAVHDFLSKTNSPARIRHGLSGAPFIIKPQQVVSN